LPLLVAAFDRPDQELGRLAEQCVGGQWPAFLKTPAVPAVLAEELLARNQDALAYQVLTGAVCVFAEDLRLRQLTGLYWSRTGDFDEAIRCLEPLYERWRDDEETVGLLAGVYKRRWRANREQEEWLAKAFRLYSRGWEAGKKVSSYLGINAATTALWLGKDMVSRRIAAEVCQRLLERTERLARFRAGRDLALNYWDQVALAEAQLLLGQWSQARRTYRDAFRLHADQTENIAVSRRQAIEGLEALGISAHDAASFFDESSDFSFAPPVIDQRH
jgi:tetratricopeptide (TPR) repeat protein